MKKHLNTLFVTTQGAYLSKEGETVVVKVDGEICLRVPVHTLGGIVCFGQVSCSPYLMGFCAESGVARASLEELLLELDEGAICKDFLQAQLKRNRRVERRQLPYKNIFVATVSLNATKLGGWVA